MGAFTKATKESAKLRSALSGPAGAGKTRSALEIARYLGGGKVALADTEFKSASKYAGVNGLEFDVCPVNPPYSPTKVAALIKEAADGGYDTLVIDSFTHFWNAEGGFLELVDAAAKANQARGGKYDTFGAWKTVDPVWRKTVDAILAAPIHVIVTLRAKQEHVIEEEGGKKKVRKLGMAPEIRDNFVYAMDFEGMINMDHQLIVGKNRIDDIDGKIFDKPGKAFADILNAWLSGNPAPAPIK